MIHLRMLPPARLDSMPLPHTSRFCLPAATACHTILRCGSLPALPTPPPRRLIRCYADADLAVSGTCRLAGGFRGTLPARLRAPGLPASGYLHTHWWVISWDGACCLPAGPPRLQPLTRCRTAVLTGRLPACTPAMLPTRRARASGIASPCTYWCAYTGFAAPMPPRVLHSRLLASVLPRLPAALRFLLGS